MKNALNAVRTRLLGATHRKAYQQLHWTVRVQCKTHIQYISYLPHLEARLNGQLNNEKLLR